MKSVIALIALLVLAGVVWLSRRGGEERGVRELVNEVQAAALDGLNRRNPEALDIYFATVEEGAQAAGLAETQEAYQAFIATLPANSAVQFHSFVIEEIEVHEDAGLARVTYRLHFSVVRGSQAIFSAKATQDLALLKTPRGWRISGGDVAQLEELVGTWPPR